MQTTSDSSPSKRTNIKAKNGSTKPVVTVKKSRVRKTAAPIESTPATTGLQTATAERSADQIEHMVAMAAYFLAQQRGFVPGHELDDWLEAERRIGATPS